MIERETGWVWLLHTYSYVEYVLIHWVPQVHFQQVFHGFDWWGHTLPFFTRTIFLTLSCVIESAELQFFSVYSLTRHTKYSTTATKKAKGASYRAQVMISATLAVIFIPPTYMVATSVRRAGIATVHH